MYKTIFYWHIAFQKKIITAPRQGLGTPYSEDVKTIQQGGPFIYIFIIWIYIICTLNRDPQYSPTTLID